MEDKKSNNKSLPLIYVIGMPILLIIGNFMGDWHYEIQGTGLSIYFSVLIYPLTYFISGLIIRKTDYKDALRVMVLSLLSASLAFVVEWIAFLGDVNYLVMMYSFMSFLIGQLIFIYGYDFLIKIKADTYVPVLLLITLISALDVAFFGSIVEGAYVTFSLSIRFIYAFAFSVKLARETVDNRTKVKNPVQEAGK